MASEATVEQSEHPGYVRCRGCGWSGAEEHTIWTDSEREECHGENPEAALSCPRCHSADLADDYAPAGACPRCVRAWYATVGFGCGCVTH